MVVFNGISDLHLYLENARENGRKIGFVPTMGALHDGHASLVKQARRETDIVVVSIFVNPTQFNDKEDFAKYPVTTEEDILLLEQAGCDVAFLPGVAEMYPDGIQDSEEYDFGGIENLYEGAFRPGHFKGVAQIVSRLLNIVQPDTLYMGQKDYQQSVVIKKLISLMGREDISLEICPTVREPDGLAMSSRNRRLTHTQRTLAGIIYQCLVSIQAKQFTDAFEIVKKECWELLLEKGITPDYIELANAETLEVMNDFNPDIKSVVLIAVKSGNVRLIDNILL